LFGTDDEMNFHQPALKDHLLYLAMAYPLYFLAYTLKYSLVHLQRCNVDHRHIASYRPSPKLFGVSLFVGVSTAATEDLVLSSRSYQVPLGDVTLPRVLVDRRGMQVRI
jgi:hypothetical protein